MAVVFRGMLIDLNTNEPVTGDTAGDQLGVRTADVATFEFEGVLWVRPTDGGRAQGVSVAPGTGCNLPAHRRPKGAWNGTNTKPALRVWAIETDTLRPDELFYAPDLTNPKHGFISPGTTMPLQRYRDFIYATAPSWHVVDAPASPCTNAVERSPVDERERASLVDATAAGGDVENLVLALVSANADGVGRTALIAEITAGIDRVGDDDDSAEVLRTVLDRITGFCGPHSRIDLTD